MRNLWQNMKLVASEKFNLLNFLLLLMVFGIIILGLMFLLFFLANQFFPDKSFATGTSDLSIFMILTFLMLVSLTTNILLIRKNLRSGNSIQAKSFLFVLFACFLAYFLFLPVLINGNS